MSHKHHLNSRKTQYNASNYLLKYMSKSQDDIKAAEEIKRNIVPARWYSMNKWLRNHIKERTLKLYDHAAVDFLQILNEHKNNKDIIYTCKEIYVRRDENTELFVGYAGIINKKCKERLTDEMRTSRVGKYPETRQNIR